MTETPTHEALLGLLELFETDLAGVPFPDVSAEALRAALDAVSAGDAAVQEAEASLAAARAVLEESRRAFERTGRRALAYARVYAEDDAELGGRLAELAHALASPSASATAGAEPPRRRGRPRKSEADLFEADAQPGAAAMARELATSMDALSA